MVGESGVCLGGFSELVSLLRMPQKSAGLRGDPGCGGRQTPGLSFAPHQAFLPRHCKLALKVEPNLDCGEAEPIPVPFTGPGPGGPLSVDFC